MWLIGCLREVAEKEATCPRLHALVFIAIHLCDGVSFTISLSHEQLASLRTHLFFDGSKLYLPHVVYSHQSDHRPHRPCTHMQKGHRRLVSLWALAQRRGGRLKCRLLRNIWSIPHQRTSGKCFSHMSTCIWHVSLQSRRRPLPTKDAELPADQCPKRHLMPPWPKQEDNIQCTFCVSRVQGNRQHHAQHLDVRW